MKNKKKKRIYLDYASATPVDNHVEKSLQEKTKKFFGNPSALHHEGLEAKKVIDDARKSIASAFDVHTDEIIFTSGGTESDSIALQGIFAVVLSQPQWKKRKPHLIVSAIEHAAVLETAKALEHRGVRVTYLPVGGDGLIDPKTLRKAITKDTVLVSIMYANNEIGTIQPIVQLAKEIRYARKKFGSMYPYFHTDAVQAINYLPIRIPALGVDLLSAASSKIYGPKGIGLLYKKCDIPFVPTLYGGEQESGFRPGTLSAPLIGTFAQVLQEAIRMKENESMRLLKLREFLRKTLLKTFPTMTVNGSLENRLPNNLNINLPHLSSELLVIELDAKGFAVSTKSACKSDDPELSHVLHAIGKHTDTSGSIRVSLGRSTKKSDMTAFVRALESIYRKYDTMRSLDSSVILNG